MGYIELYDQNIMDLTSIGKSDREFDESKGDYIKVEIFDSLFNRSIGGPFDILCLSKCCRSSYSDFESYFLFQKFAKSSKLIYQL